MLGIGVLVFNPLDDEDHLERIKTCVESLVKAIYSTKHKVRLFVLLNESRVRDGDVHNTLKGVGRQTREAVFKIVSSHPFISVESVEYNNSMAVGYNHLLKKIHQDGRFTHISIFADDYIIPTHWIGVILTEFERHKRVDFIMPSTGYVAQKNLLVPFDVRMGWKLNIRNGSVFGVKRGVSIDDINEISFSFRDFKTIKYRSPASFETTVFSRECIDRFGYLCEEYYSTYWNTEYFQRMVAKLANGYISRRSFVFHYGKGGTSALFSEGDEKFAGSPVEKNLLNDVALYNKRNNKRAIYRPKTPEDIYKKRPPSKEEIISLVKRYDKQDIWRRIGWHVKCLLG